MTKAEKLKDLAKGKKVSPIKKWWTKMYRKVSKQYPGYGRKRKAKITAGIWHDYSIETQKRLVMKYA